MYAIVHSNACCRKPIHVPLASIKQCTFSDSSFQTKQLQENQIWTVGVKLPDFDLTYQLQVISTESQPQCHSPRSAKTEQIRIYPTQTPKTGLSTQASFCGFEPLTKNQELLSYTNLFHAITKLRFPQCQCLWECFRLLLELMSPLTIFRLSITLEAKHM
jgi:hypothetical protein